MKTYPDLSDRIAEYRRRVALRKQIRAQEKAARNVGLAKRHARKLHRRQTTP